MSRLDPPLRLYRSPPVTHIQSDTPLSLDAASTLIADFLAQAPSHPELHPNATFTHHGLAFPQSSGGGGGSLAMLAFVERGMRGEDAREEAAETLRRLQVDKETEKVEEKEKDASKASKKKTKKKKKKAEGEEEEEWVWEDPSVLAEKSGAEDTRVESWAADASVTAKNVKKVPEVKDTDMTEEDAMEED